MPSQPTVTANQLLAGQAAWLRNYRFSLRVDERGIVVSVGDGIAWIEGLPSAAMDEILDLEDGSRAMVFQLETHVVGAILVEQTSQLTAGTIAHLSGRRMGVPTGDALIGRVIDPLGNPLDGLDRPECSTSGPLDILSPPITARDFVHEPLYTGNKIVDTLIPIGKGQRRIDHRRQWAWEELLGHRHGDQSKRPGRTLCLRHDRTEAVQRRRYDRDAPSVLVPWTIPLSSWRRRRRCQVSNSWLRSRDARWLKPGCGRATIRW